MLEEERKLKQAAKMRRYRQNKLIKSGRAAAILDGSAIKPARKMPISVKAIAAYVPGEDS